MQKALIILILLATFALFSASLVLVGCVEKQEVGRFDEDTTWNETKVDLYPVVVYTDSGVEYYSYWLHDTLKPNPCPPCPDTVMPPGRWVEAQIEAYRYAEATEGTGYFWLLCRYPIDDCPDSVFILSDPAALPASLTPFRENSAHGEE